MLMKRAFWVVKESVKYLLQLLMLKIRNGPLKGKKWIVASGIKFLSGEYEPANTSIFLESLNKGDVLYDVGAHVGYYSLLASNLVGPTGQTIAFEPRPLNAHYLRRHVRSNQCRNVQLVQACVGETSGSCRFEVRTGSGTGHISRNGNMIVPIVSLDELYREKKLPTPNFIKIDVEGAEIFVLKGSKEIIAEVRPTILVATHGDELLGECTNFLTAMNYHIKLIDEPRLTYNRDILATPDN